MSIASGSEFETAMITHMLAKLLTMVVAALSAIMFVITVQAQIQLSLWTFDWSKYIKVT